MPYSDRTPSPVAEMNDLQLLTYLLTLAGETEDAARVSAHALLDSYDDLSSILTLPRPTLLANPHLDENSGAFLSLVGAMSLRYANRFRPSNLAVTDQNAVCRLLAPHFQGQKVERVCVICVDRNLRLLGSSAVVTQGDANSTSLPIQRVLALALSSDAYGVILAHNHPDGVAAFSHADLMATGTLRSKLAVLGVSLLDHYIWTSGGVVSLCDLLHAPDPPPPLNHWDAAAMPLLSRLDPARSPGRNSKRKVPFFLGFPDS